jgi:purine-cytosine permease-like protein
MAPASILNIYIGSLALIAILVDETDNAFADVYSTAISLQNPFPKIRQWKLVLLAAGVGAALAYALPLAEYEHFLLLIGASFVPLFGVFLSEFFLVRKGNIDIEEFYESAPKVRPDSIASWILGFVVYLTFAYKLPSIGATLPALGASALTHFILAKTRR